MKDFFDIWVLSRHFDKETVAGITHFLSPVLQSLAQGFSYSGKWQPPTGPWRKSGSSPGS